MRIEIHGLTFQGLHEAYEDESDFCVESCADPNGDVERMVLLTSGAHALEALIAMRQAARLADPRARLTEVFDHARATALRTRSDPEQHPARSALATWSNPLSALAVGIRPSAVGIGWVGAVTAMLIRSGRVIQAVEPHLTVVDWPQGSAEDAPQIQTRSLEDSSTSPEWLTTPWMIEPGDRVLCCSGNVSSAIEQRDLAALMRAGSPRSAALDLVARLARLRHPPDSGAVVVVSFAER